MDTANKRIMVNTAIIYVRMIIVTIVGLITARYVLLALGVSDYGLYSVVGGVLAMLNIINTAMHTTTRRYVNVEMGKPDGNLNKVFNICLVIHILLAVFIFILAETIGVFYINHYLNVAEGKLGDAHFVFQISLLVSVIGLINVPYQAVLNAYEQFLTLSLLDILQALLKLPLIYFLIRYNGNALRFYAIGICVVESLMFVAYHAICIIKYNSIVKHKLYKDHTLFKEILVFNGYTAFGAATTVAKTQGGAMIANYFLGTIVNGALALAQQIERYVSLLVSNLATSSAPQITQNYSGGNYGRSQFLVEKLTRYMVYVTFILVIVLACDLEFILTVWLKVIPEGAFVLCQWILLCLALRSLGPCLPTVIIANGRLKETSIVSGIVGAAYLIVLYILLKQGYPPFIIIVLFTLFDMLSKAYNLYFVYKNCQFDVKHYIKAVYPSISIIALLFTMYYVIRINMPIDESSYIIHIISLLLTIVFSGLVVFYLGLDSVERKKIISIVRRLPNAIKK